MAAIAVAGVGLMVVCSSSLAAVMMMGGDEDTPATTTSAGPTTPVIKKYRYVRVGRINPDGGDHWMNLAEVEVFSGGVNVASGKTVTASSLYAPQFPHASYYAGSRVCRWHSGAVVWSGSTWLQGNFWQKGPI